MSVDLTPLFKELVKEVKSLFTSLHLPPLPRSWRSVSSELDILNDEVRRFIGDEDYDRAEIVAKKALEVAIRHTGPDHPSVARSQTALGLLYKTQRKYGLAIPLFTSALDIFEKSFGPNHPHVATTLERLAALYREVLQYDKAAKLEQRAARILSTQR